MPSDRARAALVDILRNIELAESFVRDITLEQFADDMLRVYATTRALPDDLKANYRSVPSRRMAGAGNVYRHGYDVIAAEALWNTVKTGQTELRQAVEAELARAS